MKRITQKELAQRLGVHVSTVSKALKGDPAVARATVERVRACAEELGFVPDPMLGALAAYRKQAQPETYHANIAWLSNHSRGESMDHFPSFREYAQGAEKRARQLGYHVDHFWLDAGEAALRSLERMLQNRGIRALIAAPQASPGRPLPLQWERYAAVGIGYTVPEARLDRVTNDHFATMTDLLETLHQRGYTRVGCYLWEVDNERMGKRARSAFSSYSRESQCPVYSYSTFEAPAFVAWVREQQLDAVVCRGEEQVASLEAAGFQIPRDLGFAGYALESKEQRISGMLHNNERIGAAAVEWVSDKLQRSQLGLNDCPQRLLISSSWVENQSLRGG